MTSYLLGILDRSGDHFSSAQISAMLMCEFFGSANQRLRYKRHNYTGITGQLNTAQAHGIYIGTQCYIPLSRKMFIKFNNEESKKNFENYIHYVQIVGA